MTSAEKLGFRDYVLRKYTPPFQGNVDYLGRKGTFLYVRYMYEHRLILNICIVHRRYAASIEMSSFLKSIINFKV